MTRQHQDEADEALALALQVIIASEDYRPADGLHLARHQVQFYRQVMIQKIGRFSSRINSSHRSEHRSVHQDG